MAHRTSSCGVGGVSRRWQAVALLAVAAVCVAIPATVVAAPLTYAFRGVFTSERMLEGPGPGTPWLEEGHAVVGEIFAGSLTIEPASAIEPWSEISETASDYVDASVTFSLRTHHIAGRPFVMSTHVGLQDDRSVDAFTVDLLMAVGTGGFSLDLDLIDPSRQLLTTGMLPAVVTLNPSTTATLRVVRDDTTSRHELAGVITDFELVPEPGAPTLLMLGFVLLSGRRPLRRFVSHALLHCQPHDHGG